MRIKYQMASNSKESSTVLRKTLRRNVHKKMSLAEDSKTTADDSNVNNRDVRETIEHLIEEAGKLSEIVSRINGRTDNLVESSNRITESFRLVKNMADNVEDSLKQILEE